MDDQARKLSAVPHMREYKDRHPHDYKCQLMEIRKCLGKSQRDSNTQRRCLAFIQKVILYMTNAIDRPVLLLGQEAWMCWHIKEKGWLPQKAEQAWQQLESVSKLFLG